MRLLLATRTAAAVLLLTACGGGGDGGSTAPPTPTPTPTTGTPLVTGTIATGGGTLTVSKPGDALNGLTLTVPSGAFTNATSISISSSAVSSALSMSGVSTIGPMIRISSDASGLAGTPMTLIVPAKVPAGSVPFVAVYDSVSKRYFPLTTVTRDSQSVVATLAHLDANVMRAATARIVGTTSTLSGVSLSVRAPTGPSMQIATFAFTPAVLMQDFDTGFKPGVDDWGFTPQYTYPVNRPIVGGATMTEAWYYATGQNSVPLRNRYPVTGRVSFSNKAGIRFAAAADLEQNGSFSGLYANAYGVYVANTTAILSQLPKPDLQQLLDSLAFMRVRATFALATLNAQRPVPVFMQLRNSDGSVNHSVIVYKAVGRRLSIADATLPGDGTLFLEFPPKSTMTPYTPSSLGVTLERPFTGLLGEVVDPAAIGRLYTASVDPSTTAFDKLFPAVQFASWFGRVYDTTYVVDTLRFWGECPTCASGFLNTLNPKPANKVVSSSQTYILQNGAATDSVGLLSPNGILASSSDVPKGGELVLGFPISAATTDGISVRNSRFTWLDWKLLTIRRLDVTMTPASTTVTPNANVSFAITVPAAQLPRTAVYRFLWNDGTAARGLDAASTAQHAFSTNGTYKVVGEIVDSRNNQVIGRATTDITVGTGTLPWSSWRIVPTGVVGLPNMPTTDTTGYTQTAINATRQIAAWWNAPTTGVRARTFWYVAANTSIPGQGPYTRGLYVTDSGQTVGLSELVPVLTSGRYTPGQYDDDALGWTFAGPTISSTGAVTGRFVTRWPGAYVPQACLLQDEAPYVYHDVTFNMNGNTAAGTITYTFRAVKASCQRPRAVANTWQMQVAFTATRIN